MVTQRDNDCFHYEAPADQVMLGSPVKHCPGILLQALM